MKPPTDLLGYSSEKEKDTLSKRTQLYEDLRNTFETNHGRRVLLHILSQTFMFDSVFTKDARTYYNSAIQDYGKAILDLIAIADPDTYLWIYTQRVNDLTEIYTDEMKAKREAEEQ